MSIRSRIKIPIRSCDKAEFVSFSYPGYKTEDVAIVFPGWENNPPPLIRIHSECLTGDIFGSLKCDCQAQLHEAIDIMSMRGGVLIYLKQEGRGIGLYNKLDAYSLQDNGMDTFEANRHLGFPDDARNYKIAARMLKDLDIKSISLLSNNPDKAGQLKTHGIHIDRLIPTLKHSSPHNKKYLVAKKAHGHLID